MTKPSSIEVWGGEAIGDKAGMLREHEALINEHDMQIPPTVILASEAMRPLIARGLRTKQDFARKRPDLFTTKVWSIIDRFSDVPAVAVRSSAEGDARGSGIYESFIVPPERETVSEALWGVAHSFHEPVARDFRRLAELGEDFAVIIQPIVGQLLDQTISRPHGPVLSGTAYSSTNAHNEGVLNLVAGFGGGVNRRGGERITAEGLQELLKPRFEDDLHHARWRTADRNDADVDETKPMNLAELVYVRAMAEAMGRLGGTSDFRDPKRSFLYEENSGVRGMVFYNGMLDFLSIQKCDYDYDEKNGQVVELPAPLQIAMDRFEPGSFLQKLQSMEQRAGYPLYIEWAATVADNALVPWVVQIAPAEHKNLSEVEVVDFEQVYYKAHIVTGSGHKTARNIVQCMNPKDLEHLRAYNAVPENDGYVLVYSSRLTTAMASHGQHLSFGDCHRASVILEEQDAKHGDTSPVEHILGAVDLTDKFFGVIDYEAMDDTINEARRTLPKRSWAAPNAAPGPWGLSITEGEFTIVADELNDRLLLGKV